MQRDPGFFDGKASPTDVFEVGCYGPNMGGHYSYGVPAAPAYGAALPGANQELPSPLDGFEFQPSEICPKNFIIFDQTDNRSRVMFHPALAQKFNCPHFDPSRAAHADDGKRSADRNNQNVDNYSSSFKEDTGDIDALLSSEEEGEDELISTGRAPGSWGGSSPNSSCSTEGHKSRKMDYTSSELFASGASSSERKRERTRKMVRVLRGIIPGGENMDTPAILDEAVKYLKSLKVEMKKLGVHNFD